MRSGILNQSGPLYAFTLFLTVCTLTISCKKDTHSSKEFIQGREWEQLSGFLGDSVYTSMKFFHKVSFNADGTFDMLIDWKGGISFPDTMTLTLLHGDYDFDPNPDKIIFPKAIDSLLFKFGSGNPELYYRYFTPWKILLINDTMLIVETDMSFDPPKEPAFIWFPGYRFHFKSNDARYQ